MSLNLIPDDELDNLSKKSEDILGTYPYVLTLFDIVTTCTTPFNVGLLGGWGTGKSSIIKSLRIKLKKDKPTYKFFIYDAWKYSKDPLRRTFINELVTEFELSYFKDINKIFYHDLEEEVGKKRFNWIKAIPFLIFLPLLIFLISTVSILFQEDNRDYKVIVSIFSLLVTLMSLIFKDAIITQKTKVLKTKLFSPEQFQLMFDEIVDILTVRKKTFFEWIQKKELKSEKLIVVVDNIDRCNEEVVVDLLLTIKGFLDKENVIFILPVDEDSVVGYLNEQGLDGKEFLRKICNQYLRIKKFSSSELYDYAWRKVKKYNLHQNGLNEKIVDLACKEYSNNPRKIIQFLNNFQSEINLILELEKGGNIPKGSVSNNLEFLAALQIIREEWPEIHKKLYDDNQLINKIIDGVLNNGYSNKDAKPELFKPSNNSLPSLSKEQILFFRRLSLFKIPNSIEPFIVTKDLLIDIPDKMYNEIMAFDWKAILQRLEKGEFKITRLFEVINDIYDKDVRKNYLMETSGLSLFILISLIVKDKKHKHEIDNSYDKGKLEFIDDMVEYSSFTNFIKSIQPANHQNLVDIAIWYESKENNKISKQIIQKIKNDSKGEESYDHLEMVNDLVSRSKNKDLYIKQLRDLINNTIIKKASDIVKLNDIITSNNLFTDNGIKSLIEYFNGDDKPSETIGKIIKYNQNQIDVDILKSFYKKVYEYTTQPNIQKIKYWTNYLIGQHPYEIDNEMKAICYQELNKSFNYINDYNSKLEEKNPDIIHTIINLINLLLECIVNELPQWDQCLNMIFHFYPLKIDRQIEEVITEELDELIGINDGMDINLFNRLIGLISQSQDLDLIKAITPLVVKILTNEIQIPQPSVQRFMNLITDKYFAHTKELEVDYIKWVTDIKDINEVEIALNNIIDSLPELEKQIKFLETITEIKDKKFIRSLPYKILLGSKTEEDYLNNIDRVNSIHSDIKPEIIESIRKIMHNNFEHIEMFANISTKYEWFSQGFYDDILTFSLNSLRGAVNNAVLQIRNLNLILSIYKYADKVQLKEIISFIDKELIEEVEDKKQYQKLVRLSK